jgi:hypothetical protein
MEPDEAAAWVDTWLDCCSRGSRIENYHGIGRGVLRAPSSGLGGLSQVAASSAWAAGEAVAASPWWVR